MVEAGAAVIFGEILNNDDRAISRRTGAVLDTN
jgi:hypothetical protein